MNLRTLLITGCVSLLLSTSVFAAGEYVGERNAFNRFHGTGTYKYTNGNVYQGEWVDGRKNGQGTQTWANGEKYVGGWSNNREHGEGSKAWPDGSSYTGEWLQGKRSGKGTFKWANGDSYTGEYIADQKQGGGVFIQAATGAKYEGNWKDDQREGDFTVTLKNGTVSRGVWKAGKAPAKATVVFDGGALYSGPVSAGYLPNGKGTCTDAGKTTPCEFKAGKKLAVVAIAKPKPAPQPKPAPKPKPVPVQPKVDAAKPQAKPFIPSASGVAAAAVAAPVTSLEAKQPAAPEQPKDPRTKRGVRADGSQFFFKHGWGGYSDNLTNLKVAKNINEFGAMQLSADGGDFELTFTIDEYVGESTYELKYFKASIQKKGESKSYRTSSSEPGTLTVLQDGDGMLIGTFSFTGYPYGNVGSDKRVVSEGEFAVPLK